jgi:O-antigen ligase
MAVGTAAGQTARGSGERRPREGARRSSSEAPAWLSYATIALLAWLPLPIGGYADWAAALAATLTGLLLLAWLTVAWRRSLLLAMPRVLPLSALLVMGAAAWSVLQAVPGVLPPEWNHPIWEQARQAGLEVEGVVSLSRTAWYDALLRLLAACGMFLLAFGLAQREAQARRLLQAILAIVTTYAVFGLLQELTGFRLSGSDAYRASVVSTFVNRNHFATYANLGLIIALGLMIEPLLRGDATQQGRWTMRVAQAIGTVFEERRLPLMAAVVILLAVIGSDSRGGILSLAGAVAFLLALVFLAGRAKRSTKVMASIATLGAGLLVVWLTGDVVIERFQALLAVEGEASANARLQAWAMTLDAIAQRPWLGYGHGAFLEVFYLHGGPELGAIGIWDHAHNDYLQLAVELGLPAAGALVLAYLLLWGQCVAGVFLRQRRQTYPLVAATAGVLVALHAIVDFSLLMPAVAMTFAALLGIGCAQAIPRSDRSAGG